MKKIIISICTGLILFISIYTNVSAKTKSFSVSKQKSLLLQAEISNDFIQLPEKNDVSLDKIWKIKFSSDITLDKIDGVLIQKDSQFVPANISIADQDEIDVQPITPYAGNSTYSLKIFLNNGKKYIMNFSTENSPRNADTDSNYIDYMHASQVNLGETILGSLTETENYILSDYERWYKLFVGKDCNLDLTLQNNNNQLIYVYIYGKDGDNTDPIAEYRYGDNSVIHLSQGLQAGQYYIRVYSLYKSTFKMNINYTYNNDENDSENNDEYLSANTILPNATVCGHIGYGREDGSIDDSDYYKIAVDNDGILDISLEENDGNPIKLYLCNKYGDTDSPISYSTDSGKSAQHILTSLEAGTYYIKVANSNDNYGSYTLTTNFQQDSEENDGVNDRTYIHALDINLGETKSGHIGFINNLGKKNDEDWYKITLTSDTDLTFNFVGDQGNFAELYLYDKNDVDSSQITSSYSNNGIVTLSRKVNAGTYYLKVESGEDCAQGYKLTSLSN